MRWLSSMIVSIMISSAESLLLELWIPVVLKSKRLTSQLFSSVSVSVRSLGATANVLLILCDELSFQRISTLVSVSFSYCSFDLFALWPEDRWEMRLRVRCLKSSSSSSSSFRLNSSSTLYWNIEYLYGYTRLKQSRQSSLGLANRTSRVGIVCATQSEQNTVDLNFLDSSVINTQYETKENI